MEIRTCEEYVLAKLKELENADNRKDNTIFNLQQIIYSLQRVFRLVPNEDGLVTAQLDFETLNNEKDLRDMLINVFGNPADFNKKPVEETPAPVQQEAQPKPPMPVELAQDEPQAPADLLNTKAE